MTDLKKKFEGFGVEPSPEVWEGISAGLDMQKKRKRGWFFLSGTILLLGIVGGMYLLENNAQIDGTGDTIEYGTELQQSETKNNSQIVKTRTLSENQTENEIVESSQSNANHIDKMNGSEPNNFSEPKDILAEVTETAIPSVPSENLAPPRNRSKGFVRFDLPKTNREDPIDLELVNAYHEADGEAETISNEILFLLALKPGQIKDSHLAYTLVNSVPGRPCCEINFGPPTWQYSLNYKHGLTKYDYKIKNTYTIIPQETFLAMETEPIVETYCTEYMNASPFWIEFLAKKSISKDGIFVVGAEYAQQKSTVTLNGDPIYNTTNSSGGLMLGYEHQMIDRRRTTISIGATGIGKYSSNNSYLKTPNIEFPRVSGIDELENDNISKNDTDISSVVAELNTTIHYSMSETIGFQIKPFYRKFLSKDYPTAALFGGGEQWGVGVGLTFQKQD